MKPADQMSALQIEFLILLCFYYYYFFTILHKTEPCLFVLFAFYVLRIKLFASRLYVAGCVAGGMGRSEYDSS